MLALAACLAAPIHARTQEISEEEIKAVFLFNFAKYVTWPARTLPDGKLRICVVADAPFVKKFDAVIDGETVGGRAIIRPPAPEVQDIARTCDVLFVGASESGHVADWLAGARAAAVLTVGETEGFWAKGGMVAFVKDGDRVRFDINRSEADRAGLTISSRLLRLARHVGGAPDPLQ